MKHVFSADELFRIETLVKKLTPEGKKQFFAGNAGGLKFRSVWDDLWYYDRLREVLTQNVHKNESLRRNCGV